MKTRVFSLVEIFISSVIVLILAFTLILSLAILNKNISRQSVFSQELSCSKSLQSFLNNQFSKDSRFYSIEEKDGKIFLQKISSENEVYQGIGIINQKDQSLKIFVKSKRPNNAQYSYFYYLYNLKVASEIDSGADLEQIAALKNKSDLFDKSCQAENSSTSLKPFSLKTINRLNSGKKAIEVVLNDKVGSTRGSVWLAIKWRQLSEFF